MHFNLKFIMLVTTLILKYVYSTHFEGDSCFIRALNKDGVCTIFSSCSSAMELLRTRMIFPTICGHKNRKPIVCCEKNNVTTTPNTPSIEEETISCFFSSNNSFQTPTSTAIPQIGDKSRQKCKEYANYECDNPTFDFILGRDLSRDCEIVPIENIVGVMPVRPKEFPHLALIGFERDGQLRWLCVGSLISENYILSVAHCQSIGNYGAPTYVLLGESALNSDTDGAQPQKIPIERVIPHDEYVPNELYNDIALYKLQHNAVFNPYIRPACLNSNSTRDIGLSIASSWGNPAVNEKVVLEMYTNDECNFKYRNWTNDKMKRGIIKDSQICAGCKNESIDACLGAFGSPLQIIKSSEVFCTHIIVGINSFGRYCGMTDTPLVYTKVSHYIEWIEGIVWP